MTAPASLPSDPSLGRVRALLVCHFLALVALRLVYEADDFNNWDLVSFLNANAFSSLGALLDLPQVHFRRPFSFPVYNTGAESVLSILLHRAFSQVSLYWSNAAVLFVYDLVFVAALYRLFRLVFAEVFLECLAWALLAMSPVVLTFASTSAFDMQGFATLALALLGTEYVVQSRPAAGVALLVINHPDRSSDQWMWTPALQRNRRIALQDRSTRFFGTDAWRALAARRVTDAHSQQLRRGLVDLYLKQLRTLWKDGGEMVDVYLRGEQRLYKMLFASDHPAAKVISGWIKTHSSAAAQGELFT